MLPVSCATIFITLSCEEIISDKVGAKSQRYTGPSPSPYHLSFTPVDLQMVSSGYLQMQSLLEHNYNFNKSDCCLKSVCINTFTAWLFQSVGLFGCTEGSRNSKVILAVLILNGSEYLASFYTLSPEPHILPPPLSLSWLLIRIRQSNCKNTITGLCMVRSHLFLIWYQHSLIVKSKVFFFLSNSWRVVLFTTESSSEMSSADIPDGKKCIR